MKNFLSFAAVADASHVACEKKKNAKKAKDRDFLATPNSVEEATIEDKVIRNSTKKPRNKEGRSAQLLKKNTERFEPMTKPVDLRINYNLGSMNDKYTMPPSSRDLVLVLNLYCDFILKRRAIH